MAKNKSKKKNKEKLETAEGEEVVAEAVAETTDASEPKPKMSRKKFEKELEQLQIELVKMQEWVKATGAKVCVLFEGRDAAGKGGIIKCITERTSPRVFRVVAPAVADRAGEVADVLPALHAPSAGRRRSRALRPQLVQPGRRRTGDGLHHRRTGGDLPEDTRHPLNGRSSHSGIILVKYWLEETMEDQTERFEERINDYRKIWKLSPMDLESHRRWYDYSRARDAMFAATDTPESPWYVVDSHDQKRGRLNCISHLLSLIPYEEVPHEKVKLPKRQPKGDYVEPDYPFRRIPEKY